jgi:hypothetical protein
VTAQDPTRRVNGFAFTLEMIRDLQRNPLERGEMRVFEDVIVFEDTMRIMEGHRQRTDVWWCRPDRFPWVMVLLGHIAIHTSGYLPMPIGTRIHARVIWRAERFPYAVSMTGPVEFRQPLRPPRPIHLSGKR